MSLFNGILLNIRWKYAYKDDLFGRQIGYKEDAKVEDKFGKSDRIAQGPDPDEEEKDDEKPSVRRRMQRRRRRRRRR